MTTSSNLEQETSEALPLYDRQQRQNIFAAVWEIQRASLTPAKRATILSATTDRTLLLSAFADASPEELLAIADNYHSPAEVLIDLAHNLVILTKADEDGNVGHISLRRPHPQRAHLKVLLTLNPATPDGIVSELTGLPVDVFHPRSIALTLFYKDASTQQQVTVASHRNTPAAVLSALATAGSPDVRVAVAQNESTPVFDLLNLRADTATSTAGISPADVVAARADEIRSRSTADSSSTATLDELHTDVVRNLLSPKTVGGAIHKHYLTNIDN